MTQFSKYAEYYDSLYQGKPYKEEVDKIESFLTQNSHKKVKRILSLGCGTGTYEIELAKRGYSILAIDLSQDMLDIAAQKIQVAGVENSVQLMQGDMRTAKIEGHFDAAIMMFNIAGYLHTTDDMTAVVSNIGKNIDSGDLFLFDAWYGPAVEIDPPGNREKEVKKNNSLVTRKTTAELDKNNKLVKITFSVLDRGAESDIVEEHPMRYWFLDEIDRSLKQGGFELIKTTSFRDITSTVSSSEWDMFVLARKI